MCERAESVSNEPSSGHLQVPALWCKSQHVIEGFERDHAVQP